MAKKKDKYYDMESGEVMVAESGGGVQPTEPLRLPGVLRTFTERYIPAPDERHATDVLTIAMLRDALGCWVPFGAKKDPLQDYLDELSNMGFLVANTCSGPAICVIEKKSQSVINIYDEAEEVKI